MRTFLMLCLVALITGCSKDEDPEPTATLNVNELVDLVDKTPDEVKANFKSAKLEDENSTLGKVTLKYRLNTKDVNYSIAISSNEKGKVSEIEIYGLCDGGYSKGIELYKSEMDKINSARTYQTYIARYSSQTAGLIDFQNRHEFWDYIVKNDVSTFAYEYWWIINEASVKFDIEGKYSKSSNSISIIISKKVWD